MGRGKGGGAQYKYRIREYKVCIKQMSNKDILHSTGTYSNYIVIPFNRVLSVPVLNNYAIHLKLI